MKLDEFINKYINTKVDFDGAFGAQCVDLFRQYCKDVLDIPHTGSVDGAKDIYLNYYKMEGEKKYFYNITNIFIPTKSGEYIMIRDADENRFYEAGRLVGFEQGYKIPVKVDKWEKKTYVPYSKEDDAGSSDEQDTEHKAI